MYQSKYRPKIEKYDLPELTALFEIFDKVYIADAGFVGQFNVEIKPFGNVTVSYLTRECHLKAFYTGTEFDQKELFDGYLPNELYDEDERLIDRETLLRFVKKKLVETVNENLA